MKKSKIINVKQSHIFLVCLLFLMGCYSTQCQNSNHIQLRVAKSSTLKKDTPMKYNQLTKEEQYVILNKGTERPFTGEYTDHFQKGTYIM
jgi:hypothetical protein